MTREGRVAGLLGVFALGITTLTGLLCLALPFWGDQALFTVYGRALSEGAVLYRDVFDVKQPGIFYFYAAGGSVFGFTEIGIHLFELVYWLAFSAFALITLRPFLDARWAAPLVPVATVGAYYLSSEMLELTQVEMLVGFPILVSWWLVERADPTARSGTRSFAEAGFAFALVILFKHLYGIVVLAFVAYAVLRARRRGVGWLDLRRSLAAFGIAAFVPLAIVAASYAVLGQLGRIWWAYFEMAPAAQLGRPRPISYFVLGARRFLIGNAPLVILAALGTLSDWRDRRRPRSDLVDGMVLWLVAGGVAFIAQGWPLYKWILFIVPMGILSVVGLEALVALVARSGAGWRALAAVLVTGLAVVAALQGSSPEMQTRFLLVVALGFGACAVVALRARPFGTARQLGTARPFGTEDRPEVMGQRWVAVVVVASLGTAVGLAAIAPMKKVDVLVQHDFGSSVAAREAYRRAWSGAYAAADQDLARLGETSTLSGGLYVFGDPVVLLRADRPQAVPILGWGPEFLDERAWGELEAELRSASPRYIVIDDHARSVVRRRQPEITDWIGSSYEVFFEGASGTWYVRR